MGLSNSITKEWIGIMERLSLDYFYNSKKRIEIETTHYGD